LQDANALSSINQRSFEARRATMNACVLVARGLAEAGVENADRLYENAPQ
jgi:hypothetical protein